MGNGAVNSYWFLTHHWFLASLQLCRSIVCSSRFRELINERNILFWAVDEQSEEGKRGEPCHTVWVCPMHVISVSGLCFCYCLQ